jgi:GNAT superfamily N-acetyltransferase
LNVVAVTDAAGAVVDAALFAAAEPVHRQLRPHLPADYRRRMEEVFRVLEKTFTGRELYCDDLVTDEAHRSGGAGRAMIAYMERLGRERGCDVLALDSGCQRQQAHKFYFREGLVVGAFHFSKKLK